MLIGYVLAFWALAAAVAGFRYREELVGLWREPTLKRPVLIFESDDWGVGPQWQADVLGTLRATLRKNADAEGRHPVFALGVVLGSADGPGTRKEGRYKSVDLRDERFRDLRQALEAGFGDGVFTFQLHGKEHFWPPAVIEAAQCDPVVADWLEAAPEAQTEDLPAALQSRWIDGSVLPSRALDPTAAETAASEEVAVFRSIFGSTPSVAVPSTFIWVEAVERGWCHSGVRFVITPGRRFESRDNDGQPAGVGRAIRNGDRAASGALYLVRDDYFEPALKGHNANVALAALATKARLGRPCLLEIHRANFLDADRMATTVREVEKVLAGALKAFPEVAFISTEALALAIENCDPRLIDERLLARTRACVCRLDTIPRLKKSCWLTSLIIPLSIIRVLLNLVLARQERRVLKMSDSWAGGD